MDRRVRPCGGEIGALRSIRATLARQEGGVPTNAVDTSRIGRLGSALRALAPYACLFCFWSATSSLSFNCTRLPIPFWDSLQRSGMAAECALQDFAQALRGLLVAALIAVHLSKL